MILRRVIDHFKKQEWTAIALDFLIVVIGVFVGMQVTNWNEARVARKNERAFVVMVRDTMATNADDIRSYIDLLDSDLKYGSRAADALEKKEPCADDCWPRIIDLFLASQWIDTRGDRTAFNEIQRTGLPRDAGLKAVIIRYYGLQDQLASISAQLPEYRALARSIIPARAQLYYWSNCFRAEGQRQYHDEKCASPLSKEEERSVYESLQADPQLGRALNYWLSTVSIIKVGLATQLKETDVALAAIDRHLETLQ